MKSTEIQSKIDELKEKSQPLFKEYRETVDQLTSMNKALKEAQYEELLPLTLEKVFTSEIEVFDNHYHDLETFIAEFEGLALHGYNPHTNTKSLWVKMYKSVNKEKMTKNAIDAAKFVIPFSLEGNYQKIASKLNLDPKESVKFVHIYKETADEGRFKIVVKASGEKAFLLKGDHYLIKEGTIEEVLNFAYDSLTA